MKKVEIYVSVPLDVAIAFESKVIEMAKEEMEGENVNGVIELLGIYERIAKDIEQYHEAVTKENE